MSSVEIDTFVFLFQFLARESMIYFVLISQLSSSILSNGMADIFFVHFNHNFCFQSGFCKMAGTIYVYISCDVLKHEPLQIKTGLGQSVYFPNGHKSNQSLYKVLPVVFIRIVIQKSLF